MSEPKTPVWRHVVSSSSALQKRLNELSAEGYAIKEVHFHTELERDLSGVVQGEVLEIHIVAFNPLELAKQAAAVQATDFMAALANAATK